MAETRWKRPGHHGSEMQEKTRYVLFQEFQQVEEVVVDTKHCWQEASPLRFNTHRILV